MKDLTADRKAFLASFPPQYRDHIISFAKNLSTINVDVLILTARKAVCLFHCLEYLGLFEPTKRLVISERWMDHDRTWLKNKRIAIVDEVIVTGTSIYKLTHELLEVGVAHVEVHCLFVNGSYFVEDFFKNINLSRNYIKLSGEEAQALSTAIVDAMYTIPRPYSVDYPMSTWTEVSTDLFTRLAALPAWQTVERNWMAPNKTNQQRKVSYYRVTPRDELSQEVDRALGCNIYSRCLVKIRLYGYVSGAGGFQQFTFRIVPYIVLGELPLKNLDRLFAQLLSHLSLSDQEVAINSCITEESRLRLVQYVLSVRLAQFWVTQLAAAGIAISFRQDSNELNYIFPKSLHEILEKIARKSSEVQIDVSWPTEPILPPEINHPLRSASAYKPTYYQLVEPFSKMYQEKELKLRTLALELGEEIFHSPRYTELLNRLNKGISVDQLRTHALRGHIGASNSTLSDFLDLGIDSGVIVPITVCSTVRGIKYIYRAYRHGEETYIVERDMAMFHAMLDKFARQWQDVLIKPTATDRTVPKIVVEKLLVMFMRYALGSDLLRTNYERLDTDLENGSALNVGYHRHGARLSIAQHDPTEFPQDRAFVNQLIEARILRTVRSGGYAILAFTRHDVLDAKRRSAATKFGGVMGKALSLPLEELLPPPKDMEFGRKTSPSKIRDQILVSLTTCETAGSTLLAVGAEFRLLCEYFSGGFALPVGKQTTSLSKLESFDARFFLNNAIAKINMHLDRVASTAAERLRDLLGEDSLEAAVWTEIWDTAVQHHSISDEREANKQLLRCLRLAWQLDFNIQLLTMGLRVSLNMPAEANKATLEQIISKIGRKADELAGRANRSKINKAAMSAFAKMASEVEGRFQVTLTRWVRVQGRGHGSPRSIAEETDKLRAQAASLYVEIDSRYRERTRLAKVERFDNVLVMRACMPLNHEGLNASQRHKFETGLIRELQGYANRVNTQAKPRVFRGLVNAKKADNLIQVRIKKIESYLEIRMTGRGPWIPQWFGNIVGKFLSHDNYSEMGIRATWISILGLDETRQYARASDTDEIVGSPDVDQLISNELLLGVHEGRLISAASQTTRDVLCKAFQEEYSSVRKSKGASVSTESNIGVDSLGGTATVCTYLADIQTSSSSAATSSSNDEAVLVLASEWSSHHGGLSTFNRMFCCALAKIGVKVCCAVQEASSADIEDAQRHGVQLIVSPAELGAPIGSGLFRSFQLPVGFKPSVVVGHGRVTGHIAKAQVSDRFNSAQRVHFVHMAPGEIEWYKDKGDSARVAEERENIERAIAVDATLVAAVGERLLAETESNLAGSGASLFLFEPALMEQTDAEPLQLDHCLLLGRAEDWKLKGIDIAARAISIAAKKPVLANREVELVVRGAVSGTGDSLRETLLDFCDGTNVQIRVREFRAKDDVILLDIRRASVLLMPSRREGFGLVALEAISAGVPTLVSDRSGIANLIKRYAPQFAANTIISTVDDLNISSEAWADAISYVLRDKKASFIRAKELRFELHKQISWQNSAEKMMTRLLELKQAK